MGKYASIDYALLKKQRAEGNSIIKGTRKKKSIKNYCTPIK